MMILLRPGSTRTSSRSHKLAAMRAYATQIDMESGFFALQHEIVAHEYFRCVRGHAVRDAGQFETDLFAGL